MISQLCNGSACVQDTCRLRVGVTCGHRVLQGIHRVLAEFWFAAFGFVKV